MKTYVAEVKEFWIAPEGGLELQSLSTVDTEPLNWTDGEFLLFSGEMMILKGPLFLLKKPLYFSYQVPPRQVVTLRIVAEAAPGVKLKMFPEISSKTRQYIPGYTE